MLDSAINQFLKHILQQYATKKLPQNAAKEHGDKKTQCRIAIVLAYLKILSPYRITPAMPC